MNTAFHKTRRTRYILVFLFSIILLACQSPKSPDTQATQTDTVTTTPIQTAQENEMCGGPENILCDQGYECVTEENNALQFGICTLSVVDTTLSCTDEKEPVCGYKNDRKNGYLNACHAKRHGADILNEGLCTPEVSFSQSNKCEAKTDIVGLCNSLHTAYEFRNGGCEERSIRACGIASPFSSLADCEAECLNP